MTDAERAALRLAMLLAMPCFPCLEDKRPATPNGYKNAALPEAGLATLWFRYPGPLIGVPTGRGSDLAVLDIDPRNGGREWYEAHRDRLPPTRRHRTRSGGLHVLFEHRAGLKCSVGKIAKGVDVRAEGGYVIWWPAHRLPVQDAPLAEWPEWLTAERPKEPDRKGAQRAAALAAAGADIQFRGVARRVQRASPGERNSVAYWAACRAAELVIANKMHRDFAADVIVFAAKSAGLSEEEARRTVASAFRGVCHG